jgi:uncharacterized LabA/DUF88 family protein
MNNATELRASGIFVDLENMANGQQGVHFDISQIMSRASAVSSPVLRKAYGNWGRFAPYRHDFMNEAFDLSQFFKMPSGKNGLDMQMSVDALEAIYLFPHIELLFLVTGDTDFCPLVRVLRKHGRQVIGIGWLKSTGKAFRQHCDDFWPYDEIAGLSTVKVKSMNSDALRNLINQAAADLNGNEWVKMSTFKDAILRRDPAFDEKNYGFTGFSKFVEAHPGLRSRFSERLSDYLVQLPGSDQENGNGANQSQKSGEERFLACVRKRNMQFLGPTLQDDALLALHELLTAQALPLTRKEILDRAVSGSLKSAVDAGALTRTKINGVLQIIYGARCFETVPGDEDTPASLKLLPDLETYDLLKRAHNAHLIRTALTCGVDLPAEEWAEILMGDTARTARIEELLDEVQAESDQDRNVLDPAPGP